MELYKRNSSRPRIVAASIRKHSQVDVATIASHEQSLVRGKNMAENVLGLVLLLIYQSPISKYSKISPEIRVYCVNITKRYRFKVRLKLIVATVSIRINTVHTIPIALSYVIVSAYATSTKYWYLIKYYVWKK